MTGVGFDGERGTEFGHQPDAVIPLNGLRHRLREIVEDRLGGVHGTAPGIAQVARRRGVPWQPGEVRREPARRVRLQGTVRGHRDVEALVVGGPGSPGGVARPLQAGHGAAENGLSGAVDVGQPHRIVVGGGLLGQLAGGANR